MVVIIVIVGASIGAVGVRSRDSLASPKGAKNEGSSGNATNAIIPTSTPVTTAPTIYSIEGPATVLPTDAPFTLQAEVTPSPHAGRGGWGPSPSLNPVSTATPSSSPVSFPTEEPNHAPTRRPSVMPASIAKLDNEGILYVLEGIDENYISRINASNGSVLSNLVAVKPIMLFDVDPLDGTTYVVYATGRIEQFDAHGERSFFGAVGRSVLAIQVAGSFLFVVENDENVWPRSIFYLFNRETRTLVDRIDEGKPVVSVAYAPVSKTLYYITEEGWVDLYKISIGESFDVIEDSSHHGRHSLVPPLRLWPDESKIVSGNGLFFSTVDLSFLSGLGFFYLDCVVDSVSQNIYLLERESLLIPPQSITLVALDPELNHLSTQNYEGVPIGLFIHDGQLIIARFDQDSSMTSVLQIPLPLQ